MELKQYFVALVNFDPTIGSEIKKTRPCLIISPNEMNSNLQTIIIAPITSTSKMYPTRVEIIGNKTQGWVMLDQIRTIDKSRIVRVFNQISEEEILRIKQTLKEFLVN